MCRNSKPKFRSFYKASLEIIMYKEKFYFSLIWRQLTYKFPYSVSWWRKPHLKFHVNNLIQKKLWWSEIGHTCFESTWKFQMVTHFWQLCFFFHNTVMVRSKWMRLSSRFRGTFLILYETDDYFITPYLLK